MSKHAIPVEVLAQHTAILGKTGSGKTSTSKLAVEQVVADGFRVCVLDTIKSDWWGLTSSADGKKPGLPFKILGGPRGHVPLHASAGKAIGHLVGAGKLPLSIIDMADFEPGGIQKFFSDFAAELMRSARGVVYLVIEEAHEVAPKERAGFGAENLSIHWAKKLATAGRSKGIRLIVATQSVQSLHNSVLGSCETVIAHRLGTPAHQAPVIGWLKANTDKKTAADVESTLSSLPTGTAWVCSGEARIFEKIKFPKFATYDNAATPTGDDDDHHVKTAHVDQDELRAIIGDAVKEAEANDPKALKAKLAELTRQLADKGKIAGTTQPDPEALRAAEQRGKVAGFDDGRRVGFAEGEKAALSRVSAAVAGVTPGDATLAALPARPAVAPLVVAPGATPTRRERQVPGLQVTWGPNTPATVRGGELKILIAVAQHASGITREHLAVLTGYKQTSRNEFIRKLKAAGLVEQDGERVVSTPAGIAALGNAYEPLPTGDELRHHVLERLSGGEKVILELLIRAYPNAIDRTEIDAVTGYKQTSRNEFIRKLIARDLVRVAGAGSVIASDNLFSEAA